MTPILMSNTTPLREAFYVLSLAKSVPDAELLDEVVRQYPQFAEELTDFAIELALDALRGDLAIDAAEADVDPSRVSPAVSRAMSRFYNHLHAARHTNPVPVRSRAAEVLANPFAALSRSEFRAFTARIDANVVFVAKLRDREIEPETMSDGFRRIVADELGAPVDLVVAHFAAAGGVQTRQFYKADDKPSPGRRQSFEDAVRSSGLSEGQQQRLLSL